VASAVGDGSTAIRLIHDYLALASPYAWVNEYRLQARERFGTSFETHEWNPITSARSRRR